MYRIIYIGKYNNTGCFTSDNWIQFLDWAKKIEHCSIFLYCDNKKDDLITRFRLNGDVVFLESPAPELNIQALKVINLKPEIWDTIRELNYSINSDNCIHYMAFIQDETTFCSLELTDEDNFIVINDYIIDNNNSTQIISDIATNRMICNKNKYNIDDIVDGEEWIPI